jgi:hypothetical protein
MTHRFGELYGCVIALDVSDKMLELGAGARAMIQPRMTTRCCANTASSRKCRLVLADC